MSDSFLSTKRDKRLIRHSSFLSRVQSSSDKISKSSHRRKRRPANKLTSLDGLADALPELEDQVEAGKIRHKSLKSRKGALKRKERVVKGEMERFGLNMAQLAETNASAATSNQDGARSKSGETKSDERQPAETPTANRWAALRGYISSTMEQNPAFANKN